MKKNQAKFWLQPGFRIEAFLGRGIGVPAELFMCHGEGSLAKVTILINIKIGPEPSYPMYYQEGMNHLGGK